MSLSLRLGAAIICSSTDSSYKRYIEIEIEELEDLLKKSVQIPIEGEGHSGFAASVPCTMTTVVQLALAIRSGTAADGRFEPRQNAAKLCQRSAVA